MFKMTPTILKNFITEKATRLYPYDVRSPYPKARGEIVNDKDTCTFCGICAAKCPSGCIQVDKKTATWTYDPFLCIFCGVCVDSCPKHSVRQLETYKKAAREKGVIVLQGVVREAKDKDA